MLYSGHQGLLPKMLLIFQMKTRHTSYHVGIISQSNKDSYSISSTVCLGMEYFYALLWESQVHSHIYF